METLGRYQLIKKLATGGMAEVFLATAEGPGGFSKQLVLKRILPHFADNPQFVQMFLSEAKLAAQLDHPNIVQVFDFGQAGSHYYLAMEFVDGMNLRQLNRMHRSLAGGMPMAACARMVSQACEGLAYAHQFKDAKTGKPVHLVHRDISPDNVIVSKHGSVKVLDFGIAKAETQVHKTTTGMLKGKMAYMPPEQLQREPLDMRVDVYALGVVLFELLAGSLPFDATSEVSIIQAVMKPDPLPPLSQLVRDVPPKLEKCVARALAKSRADRYPDCKAFQTDLEAYIQESGEKWLPSDLAALVALAETGHHEDTGRFTPHPEAFSSRASMPDATHIPGGPVPEVSSSKVTGVSATQLKRVQGTSGAPTGAILAAVALLLGAAGLSAYVVLGGRQGDTPQPLVVPPPPKAQAGADAGMDAVAVAVAADEDAGAAAPVAGSGGGSEVAVVAHEGGGGGRSRPYVPVRAGKGEVEVRVRPFAILYVDGKKVGQTPLEEPLTLSAGKHAFRMVNDQYSKDVTVDFVVKPGKSVFKHNLLE